MMDLNTSNIYGVDYLINKMGIPGRVETQYRLNAPASVGSTKLSLDEVYGINPTSIFTIGSETISVSSIDVNNRSITLAEPLSKDYDPGTFISCVENIYLKIVPKFQRITQEQLEYVTRYRIPLSTTINYGSVVTIEGIDSFVMGIETSASSKAIKIKEFNRRVDILRGNKVKNDFGYETRYDPIYPNIPAYMETISNYQYRFRDQIGYIPQTTTYVEIPRWFDIRLNDRIVCDNVNYKVSGFDFYTLKNMIIVVVDYDQNR